MPELTIEALREIGERLGCALIACVSASTYHEKNQTDIDALRVWQGNGFAGEMAYMKRPPELFASLEHFLPGIKSVVCFAFSYRQSVPPDLDALPEGFGRVARYAWGRDYHRVLKKRLSTFVSECEQRLPASSIQSRVFSDSVPLLERSLGRSARLGFIGKNSLLIQAGVGSYTLLGEVLWNVDVVGELPKLQRSETLSCKSCHRCIDACPTEAIRSPREVDARRCISYLTIEKKTPFSEWESTALGEWIFGCDVCQEVCPFNHSGAAHTTVDEFRFENGAGPHLSLDEVLALRDRGSFLARFQGTPLMRSGREGLLRNACSVVANTRAYRCINALREAAERDESNMVRESARASLLRLREDADGIARRRIDGIIGQ